MGGAREIPQGQAHRLPNFRNEKIPHNQTCPSREDAGCVTDYKSRPLGAGFGSLQVGPPPATVLLNLVLFPVTQTTLLFVSISGSPEDRQRGAGLVEICPPVTSPFPAEVRGPEERKT